ncbi:phosphatase domain-containing putative toxin [Yinghuangia soli]|uniref:Dual specificity protein phosphatase family protein n=1 Tax=Yinghuangia soli TaxID=2908204 RepID=A0AA41Q2B1_9ACTN|nr:dual specificity protein phosphatase family protein [Yinghuangia soli]MCF2530254.1 dual specificity protein phosphatase family protein [Yinghuangia soli]
MTLLPHPAAPDASATLSAGPASSDISVKPAKSAKPAKRSSRTRTILRRTGKVAIFGALGYGLVWLLATLGMLGAHAWASSNTAGGSGQTVSGIKHLKKVDDKLLRGSAPSDQGYRELASMGVRTVVDLRAERMSDEDVNRPTQAGLNLVRMPIRDGQTPTQAQVDAFLATVRTSDGPVFVHCGAGVGRTGSMTAAYLVRTGEMTSTEAARATLAVGPPSIEQVYYVLSSEHGKSEQPPLLIQIISRIIDAPRRIKATI